MDVAEIECADGVEEADRFVMDLAANSKEIGAGFLAGGVDPVGSAHWSIAVEGEVVHAIAELGRETEER